MSVTPKYFFIRLIVYFIPFLSVIQYLGCMVPVNREVVYLNSSELEKVKIKWIVLYDGEMIIFNERGGSYINKKLGTIENNYIVGTTTFGKFREININKIVRLQIETKEINPNLLLQAIPITLSLIILMVLLM